MCKTKSCSSCYPVSEAPRSIVSNGNHGELGPWGRDEGKSLGKAHFIIKRAKLKNKNNNKPVLNNLFEK